MYTLEQRYVMNLSDHYTLMYSYTAEALMNAYGLEGERAVREALRRYGKDRGKHSRARHLAVSAKINMKNLFSLYFDLPPDPRFRREAQALSPTERVSHTLVCPMAEIWKENGHQKIGRIYCEEFHPACYEAYAFGHTRVNLAKTLTQDGDNYCSFNVALHPADLPADIRKACFAQYDPDYTEPILSEKSLDGRDGFRQLTIKLFHYLVECATEFRADGAREVIQSGLAAFARVIAWQLQDTADTYRIELNDELIFASMPISLERMHRGGEWDGYDVHEAVKIWRYGFEKKLLAELES